MSRCDYCHWHSNRTEQGFVWGYRVEVQVNYDERPKDDRAYRNNDQYKSGKVYTPQPKAGTPTTKTMILFLCKRCYNLPTQMEFRLIVATRRRSRS